MVLKDLTFPAHPLTNFEIQEYYQNEPRFNGVFSRDYLPINIKNGAYVINLDEYHYIGTHWVALYVNIKIVTYFDSFGAAHIPKEIMKFNGKCLADYTNLFSPNDFNKNDDIILKYFGLYDVNNLNKDTVLSYCFKCRRNTKSINPKSSKTTNGKAIILSTCAICGSKKSKFIKEQEAKGLLSNLGLRTPLNKIPVLGNILF